MKRILPVLLFIGLILFFFYKLILQGLLPIPADNIIGLYHPFRDLYAPQYPRGIPYKNYLIADPIQQQYPWRNLAITMEKKMELPMWNPYNFSGMPLLANLQSAAFYPLNILFFILPFSYGWSVLIFLEPLLGGLFMYIYLRNLSLSRSSALLGSICFAFGGFATVWMEWGTVVHTGIWLPLLLLSIDKITKNNKKTFVWGFVFILSLCSSFLAGHLQTFFYVGLVSFLYLLVRLITDQQRIKHTLLFAMCYLLFAIATAIQWIPLFQLILLSARDVDHISYNSLGWFLPWHHLINIVAPDFFGNPTTLNYWGTWNYLEFSSYIGIIPLIFALYALFFRHDRKTIFFGLILFLALVFALPTPIGKLPFIFNIPFLSTSQPSRLLYLVDFSLAMLTALGLDYYQRNKKNLWIPLSIIGIVITTLWVVSGILIRKGITFPTRPDGLLIAQKNLIFPSAIFCACVMLLVFYFFSKKYFKHTFIIFVLILIVISTADVLRFAQKFTPFTPQAYLYPMTTTLSFLEKNQGNYRLMRLDKRLFRPNFSTQYHLPSIDGYDPLYLRRYGDLIAASERNAPDIHIPFGFNRIITPEKYDTRIINLLGVKYILTMSDVSDPHLKKVWQEGLTQTYENLLVYPRAFFVANIILSNDKQQEISQMFNSDVDLHTTAVVEGFHKQKKPYKQGTVIIQQYTENTVILQTNNSGDGFLILTDVYYPTWHAYIDSKETKIYQSDYALRGIEVPSGTHTVIFKTRLF